MGPPRAPIIPGARRGHGVQLVNSTHRRTTPLQAAALSRFGKPSARPASLVSPSDPAATEERKETSTSVDPNQPNSQPRTNPSSTRGVGAKTCRSHTRRPTATSGTGQPLSRPRFCVRAQHTVTYRGEARREPLAFRWTQGVAIYSLLARARFLPASKPGQDEDGAARKRMRGSAGIFHPFLFSFFVKESFIHLYSFIQLRRMEIYLLKFRVVE